MSETDRHLRGIVGSAMDAVITVDAEQNIVMFNGMAEKVFRCPAEAAMGTALERVIPERFRAAHRRQPL